MIPHLRESMAFELPRPDRMIRLYTRGDRTAVRTIACETADRGEPLERFFHDREVFADVVTTYYTEYEPESAWVAEQAAQVVGYVTGCLDTRRYRRIMAWRVVPGAILKAMTWRTLRSVQTWRLVGAGLRTWLRGGFPPQVPLDRYPAHLHVNVREGFRGQQIGRRLIERLLAQVRAAGVRGLHVAVRADNVRSCAFFERMGFTPLSRHPVTFPDGESYVVHETVIYGKVL